MVSECFDQFPGSKSISNIFEESLLSIFVESLVTNSCKCGPHDLKLSENVLLAEFEYMCRKCNHTRFFAFMELFHRVIFQEAF